MPDTQPEQTIALGNTKISSTFAVIFHLGMAVIACSCVFTVQPAGFYSRTFFALIAILGIATLVALLASRTSFASTPAGKALTALVAAFVYSLAYDPEIVQLVPAAAEHLHPIILELTPGIPIIGLIIALAGAGFYAMASTHRQPAPNAFVAALAIAAVLTLGLSAIIYIALSPITAYQLQGDFLTRLLNLRVFEYTLLMLAVMRMTGAPSVRNAPTWYLALALVLTAIRHIVGIAMPDLAS